MSPIAPPVLTARRIDLLLPPAFGFSPARNDLPPQSNGNELWLTVPVDSPRGFRLVMRVVIAVVILAVSFPLNGCCRPQQAVYTKPSGRVGVNPQSPRPPKLIKAS